MSISDLLLAKLAQASYEGEAAAARIATLLGFGHSRFLDVRGSTEAYAFASETTVVVAVRGTDPRLIEDLIADARCLPAPCEIGGAVHCGFQEQANRLDPLLRTVLAGLPRGETYFTGHSLGAGIATIAAARYGLRNPRSPARLVTFGSPRVGDHAFCRAVEGLVEKSRRYVSGGDLITRVPARAWGFDHLAQAAYLTNGGNEGERGWRRFLDLVPGGIALEERLKDFPSLAEHDMSVYIRALELAERKAAAA